MFTWAALLVGILSLLSAPSWAQRKVSAGDWGERVLLVVPVVGTGTYADPIRPLGVPGPRDARPDGIVSIRYEFSDDKKFALVEVVGRDVRSLGAVAAPLRSRADVKAFDKGKATKAAIEGEFKLKKKDFDLDRFLRGAHGDPALRVVTPGQ